MDDVLLVEELGQAAAALNAGLEEPQWRWESAADADQADQWLKRRRFSAAVLDLRVSGGRGESVLARLKQLAPTTQFIVLAPEGDFGRGVRALKLGAYDCVGQPVDRLVLEAALRRACERAKWSQETRLARFREEGHCDMAGVSPSMEQWRQVLSKAAAHETHVLIQGEPGTGKQLAARYLRERSSRRKGPLRQVDAAEGGADLDAALFGRAAEPGNLELAAGGVLVLSCIEHLPLPVQAKLLRALQDRGYAPDGGGGMVPLDVRVVATTAASLRDRMKSGEFREDLYWALGGTPLVAPPLRERGGDVEFLFRRFLEAECRRLGRAIPAVRPDALTALQRYAFPGNVSELKAIALLAALNAAEEVGTPELPLPVMMTEMDGKEDHTLKDLVHAFERQVILRTLREMRGNQSRAAERLMVHRNTLILKMQELDIPNKRTLRHGDKGR